MGLEALFGKDPETMTPEERRLYNYVWQELQKSDAALGFSPLEKAGMRKNLKTELGDYSQQQIGSATQSAVRRGVYGPGQAAGLATSIMANAGKAYGQGITDIDLASMQAGRQRKGQLLGAATGLTGQLPQEPDLGGSMADYIANLSYYYANRGNKREPEDYAGGSYSNINPPRWRYPRRPY